MSLPEGSMNAATIANAKIVSIINSKNDRLKYRKRFNRPFIDKNILKIIESS